MNISENAQQIMQQAVFIAVERRHEFVTPEHILLSLLAYEPFARTLEWYAEDATRSIADSIESYFENFEVLGENEDCQPELSHLALVHLNNMAGQVGSSSAEKADVEHLVHAMLTLEDCYATSLLLDLCDNNIGEFMSILLEQPGNDNADTSSEASADHSRADDWKSLVECVNDHVDSRHPLVGRQDELERTIRILCRRYKNNPLHIGLPGVGKTELVYGLARLINEGRVPEPLRNARIYRMEVGSLLAGTQFRGDFEKRLKTIMDGARSEANVIIYIDEIHTLAGAGATGEGSMDASNLIKPYLEAGEIRFIGSTTYEEFNRHLAKNSAFVRRFRQIDIAEPTPDETLNILRQLKAGYEDFHGVRYTDGALRLAVDGSVRYLSDRHLPDKAIDLMDEAGAQRRLHPGVGQDADTVDEALMSEVLAHMARVDSIAITEEPASGLENLYERISAVIYGQDSAVRSVSEAVLMARAGLTDEHKPLASLLFVGPTGVGKTEVAKVLAAETGVELVRFDMSEYTEKHAVAKLIGAPAGYVGYEDGGLLTDAVRRAPNCVLLLDEIEKAHEDIYNILLQVMDYGRLTDNRGRHADFRNVVIIMTSNAGATDASQSAVGFNGSAAGGHAMMKAVKRTFKPEFINRLSSIVIFNDMDRDMASRILDKKLGDLATMLSRRNVTFDLTPEARQWLLHKGFSDKYGARELERVIGRELKPLMTRLILFGSLKNGGHTTVKVAPDNETLTLD